MQLTARLSPPTVAAWVAELPDLWRNTMTIHGCRCGRNFSTHQALLTHRRAQHPSQVKPESPAATIRRLRRELRESEAAHITDMERDSARRLEQVQRAERAEYALADLAAAARAVIEQTKGGQPAGRCDAVTIAIRSALKAVPGSVLPRP